MAGKNDYLLEDDKELIVEEIIEVKEKKKITALQKQKQEFRNKIIITSVTMLFISILLVSFGLVWQRRADLWAISNAIWLAFSIEFFVAWVFFVYNKNILSPLIHGFKVFGLMMVGKRSKESYYDYTIKIEENPIPKYIYYTIYVFSFLLLIPAVITMLMLM